jgi:hypothetical protein
MSMKAGRDLDALVAEKVMGLEPKQPDNVGYRRDTWVYAINDYDDNGPVYVVDCPEFSEDTSAAWSVLERMRELGWYASLETGRGQDKCTLTRLGGDSERLATGETLPLAICLAALKAVGA